MAALAVAAEEAGGDDLRAPMPGLVKRLAAAPGQPVARGDVLVVLEAMKMEQPIAAHRAGTVRNLRATTGATVTSGAVLCTIAD